MFPLVCMCKYRIYCSGCRSNVYSGEYKICKTYINYVVHVLDIATHVLLGKHIPGITFAPYRSVATNNNSNMIKIHS